MADDTTPRIPPLPRDEWTNAAREVFAFWGEPDAWLNGSRTNIVNTLATHPPLATAYNIFGKHLLLTQTISARTKELVVLRVAWRVKNDYEWHHHVGYAVNAGMSFEEIAAIQQGADAPNWNEQDAAVLRTVDELFNTGRIADATWATLSEHFDRPQIMDIVFTAGHYVMISWALSAFGVQIDEGVDKIGYDLKKSSGRTPSATYRPGEVEDWTDKRGMD